MPDAIIPIGRGHFAHDNGIGVAQNAQSFGGDFAENSDCETGTWERLPVNNFLRQTELQSGLAHFVFEELTQRFDQLEVHFFRQPADVVVALNQ